MTEIHIQTSVRCCGAMHSTPFCPLCGKSFAPDRPLVGLLQHVQRSATRYKKQACQLREQRDDDTYATAREEAKWLKQAEASAAKWEAWRVALSEVVNPVKMETPDA